ncbi:MAG: GNAT family N-acetyltransferase [Ginsengibacter sp.]
MNSIDPNIEIPAKRIVLHPVSMEYKKNICREFTTEVTKYMPFMPTGDITMTEEFIRNSSEELQDETSLQLCILLKNNDNEFLGCCGLHHIDTRAIEIGLWLKKSVHGKGYGLETVEALTDWANKHFDFDYLFYPVDKENQASRSIPEKLGFTAIKSYTKRKSETENLNIIEYRKNKNDM